MSADEELPAEEQEVLDFISYNGKTPDMLAAQYGRIPQEVITLMEKGYVYENVSVLRETAATPELAAQAPDEIVTYLLTDKGKFAVTPMR